MTVNSSQQGQHTVVTRGHGSNVLDTVEIDLQTVLIWSGKC